MFGFQCGVILLQNFASFVSFSKAFPLNIYSECAGIFSNNSLLLDMKV